MPTVADSPVIAMLETGNTVTWPLTKAANKDDESFTPKEIKGKASTERTARMFERFLTSKCRFDSEMPRFYTEGWKLYDGEPLYIRRGMAYKFMLEHMTPVIKDDEVIVLSKTRYSRGATMYPQFSTAFMLNFLNMAEDEEAKLFSVEAKDEAHTVTEKGWTKLGQLLSIPHDEQPRPGRRHRRVQAASGRGTAHQEGRRREAVLLARLHRHLRRRHQLGQELRQGSPPNAPSPEAPIRSDRRRVQPVRPPAPGLCPGTGRHPGGPRAAGRCGAGPWLGPGCLRPTGGTGQDLRERPVHRIRPLSAAGADKPVARLCRQRGRIHEQDSTPGPSHGLRGTATMRKPRSFAL